MDLETYISRYSGEGRLQRLLLIAKTNTDESIAAQALTMAEEQVKADGNVRRYKEMYGYVQNLRDPMQSQPTTEKQDVQTSSPQRFPPAGYNPDWVRSTEAANKGAMDVLQGRLSAAQSHLHKETIRTAFVALAKQDAKIGEFRAALGYLLRATDYCTSKSQTANISLLILEIAIHLGNMTQVREYVTKVEHTLGYLGYKDLPSPSNSSAFASYSTTMAATSPSNSSTSPGSPPSSSPSSTVVATKLKIASALDRLSEGDYASAAKLLTTLITTTSSWEWESVICPEDIALYAALLALATQSRSQILHLSEHPEALELVPTMREVLLQFSRANYQACISNLESLLPFPDLFLHGHWDKLYGKIREKCIMEYLKPYQCVQLEAMGHAFQLSVPQLQDVLADMMGRGLIKNARMDARSNTLVKRDELTETDMSTKNSTFFKNTKAKMAQMEQRVLDDTYALLVRLACMENELSVQDTTRAIRSHRGSSSARYPADGQDDSSTEDDQDAPMMDISYEHQLNPQDLY